MIIFTSINPYSRIDVQISAMNTWKDYEIYSLNSEEEIRILSSNKELDFIQFIKVESQNILKGKYIKLAEYFKLSLKIKSKNKQYCLVNSDIHLNEQDIFNKLKNFDTENSMVIGSRWDIHQDHKQLFPYGFDVFIFNRKQSKILLDNDFALGLPWWDYYVPVMMVKEGINLLGLKHKPYFTHEYHETRYDYNIWLDMGYQFCYEISEKDKYVKRAFDVPKYCTLIKNYIDSNITYLDI